MLGRTDGIQDKGRAFLSYKGKAAVMVYAVQMPGQSDDGNIQILLTNEFNLITNPVV